LGSLPFEEQNAEMSAGRLRRERVRLGRRRLRDRKKREAGDRQERAEVKGKRTAMTKLGMRKAAIALPATLV
jgi:hypothetical protein